MTMDSCICIKCGETKFPVYMENDVILFRCICEKDIDEVLEHNGYMIKGVNKE